MSMSMNFEEEGRLDPLNIREQEILKLLSKGLSNSEIAQKLNLSLETVKWYNKRIFAKLDVRSRNQAVAKASVTGILSEQNPIPAKKALRQRHNLPALITSFVGRGKEIQELTRLVSTSQLVTIIGAGGVGKTRLGIEAGRIIATSDKSSFSDGVWLVDLAQVQEEPLIVSAIADALRVISQPNVSLESTLLDYLQPRALLLILDNCEHVIDGAARFCSAVLAAGSGIHILATSQVPLGISGEVEWMAPTLAVPDEGEEPGELTRWMSFSAIQLFVERAALVRPGFGLTLENARSVLEICRHLDGMPLAIELAAARMKMLTSAEIAARLDNRFSLLTSAKRDVPSRYQTLYAAIDWSYRLLSAQESSLLNRLSIFASPWTLESAEGICVDDSIPSESIFDLVARLVDRSFVVSIQTGSETRYRLLESIRLFAQGQLIASEQNALRDRLLDWYERFATREGAQVHGERQEEVVYQFKSELPNMRAAVDWALTHPAPDKRLLQGLRIASSTSWAMRIFGGVKTSIAWLEMLLEHAKADEMNCGDCIISIADACLSLSRQYWVVSAFSKGAEKAQESLNLYERLGDTGRSGRIHARHALFMNTYSDDPAKNIALLSDLVAGYQEIGDQRGAVESYLHLGTEYLNHHHYERAEYYFKTALYLAREIKNAQFTGLASHVLAELFMKFGRWDEAYALLDEALQCFERLGFLLGLSHVHIDFGDAAILRGDLDQAEGYYRQSILYSDRCGIKWLKLYSTCRLGIIALHREREQEAEMHFRSALFDFKGLEEGALRAFSLRGLAAIYASADPPLAARLEGHAASIRFPPDAVNVDDPVIVNPRIAAARVLLGEAEYHRYTTQGASMTIEEILSQREPPPAPS